MKVFSPSLLEETFSFVPEVATDYRNTVKLPKRMKAQQQPGLEPVTINRKR